MGDRSAAQPGFVGEDAPLEAHQNDLPERSACGSFAAESVGEDRSQGIRDRTCIDGQHHQAGTHVKNRHQRNDGGSGLGDPSDASDHHSENQGPEDDASDQSRNTSAFQSRGDFKSLNAVADPESGQHAEQGEETGHPAPSLTEAIADVIHRATDVVSIAVGFTELHRQNRFGVFRSDAEHGNHPHPEDRARSTNGDGTGHTSDVSGADGR